MSTSGTLRLGKAGVKKADDIAGAIGKYIDEFGSGADDAARAGDDAADEAADSRRFLSTKTGKAATLGSVGATGVLGYKGLGVREARWNAKEAGNLADVDPRTADEWGDRNGNDDEDKDKDKGGILETVRDLLGLESSMQAAMILAALLIVAVFMMNQSSNMPTVPFPVSVGAGVGGQR